MVDLETKFLNQIDQIVSNEQDDIKSETKAIQGSLTNEIDLSQVNRLKEKSVEIQEKLNLKIKSLEKMELNYDFEPEYSDLSETIGRIKLQKKCNENAQNNQEKQISKSVSTNSGNINEKMNITVLSGSSDNTIKIWDCVSGKF